jgi:uncharacterized protein DUF4386
LLLLGFRASESFRAVPRITDRTLSNLAESELPKVTDPTLATLAGPKAKTTGIIYLLYFVTAMLGELCMKGIVVSSDAAATATNLTTHEPLFRLGLALGLIAIAFYLALTALLFDLLKPVNPTISLLAAFFSLTGCAVQSCANLFQLAPNVIFGGASYLKVFTAEQLQALCLLLLKLGSQAFNVGLIFFGFYCVSLGYLILRSTFLPNALGVLMVLAGFGWLAFLSPHLVISLSPYIQILGVIAEASLMLWLLIKGVDTGQWRKQST